MSGRVRAAGWLVGAVVGIGAGTALAFVVQDWQEAREASDVQRRAAVFHSEDVVPPPGDTIAALVEQDALVAVDPLLADRVPEADRQRAESILEDSPVPARIAYLPYPKRPEVGYTASGAAAQWSTAIGEEGHYIVLWDSGYHDSVAVGLEEHYVDTRTEGQPGPALVRLAAEMSTWEAVPLPTEPEEPSDFDYWEGVGGGIAAGALLGTFVVAPVFLLLRWFVGTRRRKAV
ncbi:hypothetical protein GCM10023339_45700 [Alloalcanivorax gelatiniphagus]